MTAIAELHRIAANAVRPAGHVTTTLVVEGTTGGRLPNGSFSGIGGTTLYGVAWFDGLRKSRPIHLFEQARDARALADILEGREPTLRSAPHSVAGAAAPAGPAEGGAVPSAVAHDRRSTDLDTEVRPQGSRPGSGRSSRTRTRPLAGPLNGIEVVSDAGSPGASRDTHSGPGIKPSGVAAARSADAPAAGSSDGGAAGSASGMASASPGPKRCAACGRDLSTLPPSPMAARRTTCSDACRQAYRRGHRAPAPGVVGEDVVEQLSRLPDRFLSGFGRGDPDPAPDPRQLAIPLPPGGTPAEDPGRARPSARIRSSAQSAWPVDHEYGE